MLLIEARLGDILEEFDFNQPYHALGMLSQIVVETTTVLNADFAPDEHYVFIRLPIVSDYE